MVGNEADIIETTVRYHLDQGLGAVYIIDNGSTDGTLEILERLSSYDRRVRWSQDKGEISSIGRRDKIGSRRNSRWR